MASSSNRKRRYPNDLDGYFPNESKDNHVIKTITATGDTIPVTVKGSDTIDEIKLKIQHAKAHFPIDQQKLLKKKFPVYTNNYNTLASEPVGFMDIFIKNLEGRITYSLEVKPSDTIGNLKAKMYGCVRVLMFNCNVLEDSGTLADLHIVNESTLTGIDNKANEKMEIFVYNTFTKKTISLLVTPKDTIANVKLLICYEEKLFFYQEKLEHIPFEEKVLIFNGMALEDSGTLFDFNVKGKSTLTLMRRSRGLMQIVIKTFRGGVTTIEVNPSYTIGNVKSKIQNKVDIPHDEQELIFNEVVLDDFDTIVDLGINKESTLTLVRKSTGHMHIFIKTMSAKTIDMKVKPSDSIYNVVSKIADIEGVPRCQLVLLFDGRRLNDSLTLADYHIYEKSTIDSYLQFKG